MHARQFALFCTVASLIAVPALATNAPSNLSATAISHHQVSLTWNDNSNNESGFTFMVDTNPAFTSPTYVWAGGAGTTSYTHGSRSAATTYYYKIKAEGNPDSSWTSADSATTAPANLAVTPASNSVMNLTWSGNGSNVDVTGYTYAYATNSSFSGATYVWAAGNGATSATRSGLSTATTYWVKIKAEGTIDGLDSPFGSAVTTTTTPANLAATPASASQINLSWAGNASNSHIHGYTIAKATNSSFTNATYHFIYGAGATAYSSTGLTAGTTYYYKIKAEGTSDAYDSPFAGAVSATTSSGAPNPPDNLVATVVSSTRIDLSWTDNSSDETGFELKRATDSAFTQDVVWIGGIQGTSYSNTGLTASTTYYYKVRAEGVAGKSAYSNTISVTTEESGPNPISPRFFGQNAWMPQYIGDEPYNGKLASNWTKVQQSFARSIRYGGIAVDREGPNYVEDNAPDVCPPDMSKQGSKMQYVTIINAVRGIDATPIIQVPVWANQWDENDAAQLVDCINNTMQLGVKYWVIGNEPDLKYSGFGAAQVADYIRRFSRAMKAADPTIKIVAPETSWFQWVQFLDPLTNGGANDITGKDPTTNRWYVDVISFHIYPYGNSFTDRDGVIGATASFRNNLETLRERIDDRNEALGRTGDDALTIAVTEANINFKNPSTDSIDGVGAVSFLGGQFWADMLGVAMQYGVDFLSFWSVIEGSNLVEDKGYLCNKPTELGHDWAHPSYHHFKMMAEHFHGDVLLPGSSGELDNWPNVKTFAAKDTNQVAVILINQDGSTDFSYAVSLNGMASSGTLQVNIPANINAAESTGTLYKQSTLLLVFDSAGTLTKKVEYRRYGPSGTPWLNTTNY